ncbi:MAG: hypothetical protein P8175_05800 [Deltaproteobacteria bacterium]
MWKTRESLIDTLRNESWAQECAKEDFWKNLADRIADDILPDFLADVADQVDEIIEIDPDLSEPRIFAMVTRYMVEFLDAQSASVRIYDPSTEQMLCFGSYPSDEETRTTYIPLENTIAGKVVKTDSDGGTHGTQAELCDRQEENPCHVSAQRKKGGHRPADFSKVGFSRRGKDEGCVQ